MSFLCHLVRFPETIRKFWVDQPGWFRVDSDRIHDASHRISRWKGVPLFEYIPIKKSKLRYTLAPEPLPVITLLVFFLRSEAADPFSGFCFLLSEKRWKKERKREREKSVHWFFSCNYFAAFCFKLDPCIAFFHVSSCAFWLSIRLHTWITI